MKKRCQHIKTLIFLVIFSMLGVVTQASEVLKAEQEKIKDNEVQTGNGQYKYYYNGNESVVLLCSESYSDTASLVLGHTIVVVFILFKIYVFLSFLKTRDLFPLKQRAPKLALIQMGSVIISRIWLYILEWGRFLAWYDWRVYTNKPTIPYMRKFSKFLTKSVRILFTFTFAMRVMVVYTQWKKSKRVEENKKWSIYKYFFRERVPIFIVFFLYGFAFLMYMFVITGPDVTGYGMLDYLTPDVGFFTSMAVTWTYIHIYEILTFFTCFVVQSQYPKEFYFGNEAMVLLVIHYVTDNYYEVIYKLFESQSKNCENGVIPRQLVVDFIRYTAVFVNLLQSQRLVYHGMPPPPADCLESLDVVMISSVNFMKTFEQFISQKHPERADEFEEMLKLFLRKSTLAPIKGSFSSHVQRFKPIYLEYKKTKSYNELRRRLLESDKVMGNMYMEGEKDAFCGNYSRFDGSLIVRNEKKEHYHGTVNMSIGAGRTFMTRKRIGSGNESRRQSSLSNARQERNEASTTWINPPTNQENTSFQLDKYRKMSSELKTVQTDSKVRMPLLEQNQKKEDEDENKKMK